MVMVTSTTRYFLSGAILALVLGLLSDASISAQPNTNGQFPARISGSEISTLIRNTMIAVNQANFTGNYTVFRDLSSSDFRKKTAADISEQFRYMRSAGIDLSSTVLIDPRIVGGARLTTDGVLRLDGYFDTAPELTAFMLVYRYEDNAWRIASITIEFHPK